MLPLYKLQIHSVGNGQYFEHLPLYQLFQQIQNKCRTVKDWKPDMTHDTSQIYAVITVHTVLNCHRRQKQLLPALYTAGKMSGLAKRQ